MLSPLDPSMSMVEASSGWWGILLLSLLDPLMGMGIVLWLSTEVIGNASWWGRTKNHQQLKTPKPNKTMVKPPVNLQHCLSRPRAKKKVPKEGESMAPEEQTGGQSYGRQRHRQRQRQRVCICNIYIYNIQDSQITDFLSVFIHSFIPIHSWLRAAS